VEWAPRSPDLNPLDFAFWGFLKAEVCAVKIRDIRHLREGITEAYVAVDPDMLKIIQRNVVHRLRTCVENWGGHVQAHIVRAIKHMHM